MPAPWRRWLLAALWSQHSHIQTTAGPIRPSVLGAARQPQRHRPTACCDLPRCTRAQRCILLQRYVASNVTYFCSRHLSTHAVAGHRMLCCGSLYGKRPGRKGRRGTSMTTPLHHPTSTLSMQARLNRSDAPLSMTPLQSVNTNVLLRCSLQARCMLPPSLPQRQPASTRTGPLPHCVEGGGRKETTERQSGGQEAASA